MYCPNCGKTNSEEQKFCRSCGLSLEKVVQSLFEQLPATDVDKNLRERQRKVELWAKVFGTGIASLFALLVLWGTIYKTIIEEGKVAIGLGFLAFIVGAVALIVLMLYRESLLKASKRPLPKPEPSPPADTAKLLPEPSFEPIPSVTERTTDLLSVERKKRGN
jgi:zinc-ribbon domain